MSLFPQDSPYGAPRATGARVIVATIERPTGDTGIHAHTQSRLSTDSSMQAWKWSSQILQYRPQVAAAVCRAQADPQAGEQDLEL